RSRVQSERLQADLQAAKDRAAVVRLKMLLAVPPEVLYSDFRDWRRLADEYNAIFLAHGIHKMQMYELVFWHVTGNTAEFNTDGTPNQVTELKAGGTIDNELSPYLWVNRSRDACVEIRQDFAQHGYLSSHPEVFDHEIRPLLLRLLE